MAEHMHKMPGGHMMKDSQMGKMMGGMPKKMSPTKPVARRVKPKSKRK